MHTSSIPPVSNRTETARRPAGGFPPGLSNRPVHELHQHRGPELLTVSATHLRLVGTSPARRDGDGGPSVAGGLAFLRPSKASPFGLRSFSEISEHEASGGGAKQLSGNTRNTNSLYFRRLATSVFYTFLYIIYIYITLFGRLRASQILGLAQRGLDVPLPRLPEFLLRLYSKKTDFLGFYDPRCKGC